MCMFFETITLANYKDQYILMELKNVFQLKMTHALEKFKLLFTLILISRNDLIFTLNYRLFKRKS